tara:strand:+ start:283 stop:927 length:645 start_codon:yes stop_codon:yes gene_type:complete
MNEYTIYNNTVSRETAVDLINLSNYNDRDNFFVDFEFLSGVDHNIWSKYNICERYKTRNPRDKENPYPHNLEVFNLLAEKLQPTWDIINSNRNTNLKLDNCWGIDLIFYSPGTILTPHKDGFEHLIITCLTSRNLLDGEGDILLWNQDPKNLDQIMKNFNKIDDSLDRISLKEGDSVYLDDSKYYHAITPITQGARVTIVSRWGNKAPDRGFDY